VEETLFGLGMQVILAQSFQNASDMDLMIFKEIREEEDIIEVYHYEDVSHVSEYMIHEGLDVVGALVSPMGITRNSKEPYQV